MDDRSGEATMTWRKFSGNPESEFNSYLAGWAIAMSVVLVTFFLIAHGVHF
jgi:hypothetical protein